VVFPFLIFVANTVSAMAVFTNGKLEQFQRKWEPVSRPELRQNKERERFR